jgi:hypothetical protein
MWLRIPLLILVAISVCEPRSQGATTSGRDYA